MADTTPLFPSERKPAGRSRTVVTAVAAIACVGAVALVGASLTHRTTVLMADGIEPVNKLSFARAEKSHFSAAKRLDDVSSRSAVDSYFNKLSSSEAKQHAADERADATAKQASLSFYFDSLGATYTKQAQAHAAMRAARHPGKLTHHDAMIRSSIHADGAAVDAAVSKGISKAARSTDESAAVEESRSEANSDEGEKKGKQQLTSGASKVKIGFYMESMCPGCKYFTTHVLKSLMKKQEFRSMVDVEVYPYGNGQLTGTQIACQHGTDECEGNKVIACIQKLYPITDADEGFFPAFVCMEAKDGKPMAEGESCANDNNLDWTQIKTCAAGTTGSELALSAAQATEGLSPAHEYAPWVTMNGAPLRDDAYNLAAKVCDSYTGLNKPSMCDKKAVKEDTTAALKILKAVGFSVCPRRSGKV